MRLTRRVALDFRELDELDPRILIQGVEPGAGKDTIGTVSLWGGTGSRVTGRHRDSLDVTVKFSLDIKKDRYWERAEVFDRIMTWASAGGWLTLSQKPGRRLRVVAAQLPSEGDPLEWTNRYSITFRAYGVPYWQDVQVTRTGSSGSASASLTLDVGGNTETAAEAAITNTSGATVNTLTLTAGGSAMTFAGLGLADGETLHIDHEDDGLRCVLRIRIEDAGGTFRTALDKRTPESSDDLTVTPGENAVTLSAGGAVTLRVWCRGRYA